MTGVRHIGIGLGNVGNLRDGLGEFALQIGRGIAAAAPTWRERDGIVFDFHVRAEHVGLFGPGVGHLPAARAQRWRHVQPVPYALWHSLNQFVKVMPPAGCGVRVATVHDLNHLVEAGAWARWRKQRRVKALLAHTDQVVAISRHTAADLQRHAGWRGPLEVIHNGARSLVGHAQTPLFEPARPFLFHLSRMSASKNPQAILALAAAWPEMDFLLCGPPSEEAKAIAAGRLPPNVRVVLGIDDAQKAWAYAHCAGFLFPSLTEGFGLPPIEAMHFGTPVFLARRTCLPEIGGDAAHYFDDFAPAAMRAVVEAGLAKGADPGRRAAVQAHAAQFDWGRAAQQYLSLYRRLLGLPG